MCILQASMLHSLQQEEIIAHAVDLLTSIIMVLKDHMSLLRDTLPSRTSGAVQFRVPCWVAVAVALFTIFPSPKSAILPLPWSRRTLADFKSRWAMRSSCSVYKPEAISKIICLPLHKITLNACVKLQSVLWILRKQLKVALSTWNTWWRTP